MSKINLEHLILEVLEQELKGTNEFLTAGELAYRCNGVCYEKKIRRKSPIVPYSIKIRIHGVRQTALDMGLVITCKRMKHIKEQTKSGKPVREKSLEIFGWKIADKDDEQFILADIEIRRMLSNGNMSGLRSIAETAKIKGLVSPSDVKELLELNE